jgi:hypothetical protein
MGYNFAGVPMGSYFGALIAHSITRGVPPETIFAHSKFRSVPFYDGTPWFVPLAMRIFDWRDR